MVLWVNPVITQTPHSCLLTHSHIELKGRKCMGWDKDNSISRGKVPHESKACKGINLLLPMGRQTCSHLQEGRASNWLGKTNTGTLNISHPPPPQLLLLSTSPCPISHGVGYPSAQLGSAVLAGFPSSLLTGRAIWETKQSLETAPALPINS